MTLTTMRAINIPTPGGPEALVAEERPLPSVEPEEVLIKVAAAGVNRPDSLQRQGGYPPPPGASDVPGLEVSGTVVEAGRAVTDLHLGDQVCALLAGGGYAEYAAAPHQQCLPIPRGLDLVSAAAIPETFFTVWTNLFDRGALTAGEIALIHGGASGIGSTAIQLARALGATVLATAGSQAKLEFCRSLGAEHAVNYKTEDFAAALKAHLGGAGVDVILDIAGASSFQQNLALLAPEGRLVIIGLLGGAKSERNQPVPADAPASHRDRLDPAAAHAPGEGRHSRCAARDDLAPAGVRHGSAGDSAHVPPGRRRRGPRAHGCRRHPGQAGAFGRPGATGWLTCWTWLKPKH